MAIKVYGADWCPMTTGTLAHLNELGLKFDYVDIDHDRKAAAWVRQQNHGREKKPTLDIDGTILTEPSDDDLDETLRELKLIS
jgi:glutaredoxin